MNYTSSPANHVKLASVPWTLCPGFVAKKCETMNQNRPKEGFLVFVFKNELMSRFPTDLKCNQTNSTPILSSSLGADRCWKHSHIARLNRNPAIKEVIITNILTVCPQLDYTVSYVGNFSEVVVYFLPHCWSKQAIALQTSISCPPAPVSIELRPIPTLNYLDCHLCIFNVPVSFFLLCCSEILLSLLIFYTFHLVSGSKVLNYRFLFGAKT